MVALAAMLAGDWTPPAQKTPANATAKFWEFIKGHGKAVEALASSFDAEFNGRQSAASNLAFSEVWNAAQTGETPADWAPSQHQFATIEPAWAAQAETIRREMADMAATCHLMGKPGRVAAFIAEGCTQRVVYSRLQAEKVAADSVEISNHFPMSEDPHYKPRDHHAVAAGWDKVIDKVNKKFGA